MTDTVPVNNTEITFDDLIAEAPIVTGTAAVTRPVVQVGRDLTEMIADAVDALVSYNSRDARVFRHLDSLVRISRVEEKDGRIRARLKGYDRITLVGELARAAEWVQVRRVTTDDGVEFRQRPVMPSTAVVGELIGSADMYTQLPALDQIVGCPVFSETGELQTTPGYSPQTRTWYESVRRTDIPDVPRTPSRHDVERAKVLLGELLEGFPFESDADRAHAIGLALTMVTRHMLVGGLVPMHGFDAPTEGTGKTLLVEALLLMTSGVRPLLVSAPSSRDDAEWDKRIASALLNGRQFIVWDNVSSDDVLDSGSLAKLLTADTYGGRLLGSNTELELPNRLVSIYTGNNVSMSKEMARRTVRTRINANMEIPSQGRVFKHSPLLPWVDENRGELLWSLYVLVRNWITQGRPNFSGQALGSYETWSRVIGGILETADIPGFLGNRAEVYESVAESNSEDTFVTAWFDIYGYNGITIESIGKLAFEHLGMRDRSGFGQPTKEAVGRRVKQLVGRVTCDRQIYLMTNRPKMYALRDAKQNNSV